jgi:hypothetical protein
MRDFDLPEPDMSSWLNGYVDGYLRRALQGHKPDPDEEKALPDEIAERLRDYPFDPAEVREYVRDVLEADLAGSAVLEEWEEKEEED